MRGKLFFQLCYFLLNVCRSRNNVVLLMCKRNMSKDCGFHHYSLENCYTVFVFCENPLQSWMKHGGQSKKIEHNRFVQQFLKNLCGKVCLFCLICFHNSTMLTYIKLTILLKQTMVKRKENCHHWLTIMSFQTHITFSLFFSPPPH